MGLIVIFLLLVGFVYLVSSANKTKQANQPAYKQADYSTSSVSKNTYNRIANNFSADEMKIVGGFYRSYDAKYDLNQLRVGDMVYFKEEPTNQYDPDAVMVISPNGFHIGYVPRFQTYDIKYRMSLGGITGIITQPSDRCYEFCVSVVSINDTQGHDNAIQLFLEKERVRLESESLHNKRIALNFYPEVERAVKQYGYRQYDVVESILKPFFDYKILNAKCYALKIHILHIQQKYEEEEKMIDEFLSACDADESLTMFLKRRKYHILRKTGVIVDDSQIENEREGIETTIRELDGFAVVEDILRDIVDPNRLDFRDSKSLFAINLDNRNKPICKLYMNNPDKMYIGLIEDKVVKYPISSAEDIKQFSERLQVLARHYSMQ